MDGGPLARMSVKRRGVGEILRESFTVAGAYDVPVADMELRQAQVKGKRCPRGDGRKKCFQLSGAVL